MICANGERAVRSICGVRRFVLLGLGLTVLGPILSACDARHPIGWVDPSSGGGDDLDAEASDDDGGNGDVAIERNPAARPCSAADECSSGFCTDGYCCDIACTDTCSSCAQPGHEGNCYKVNRGDDPDSCTGMMTCGPMGHCAGRPGQACKKGAECASNFCVDGVCCESACSDGCRACNVEGQKGTCVPIAGDKDAECPGKCEAGVCKKPDGAVCKMADECGSKFCVDGVCCNEACTGKCRSCSSIYGGAAAKGKCSNYPAGTDPENECTGSCTTGASCSAGGETCDGKGACSAVADCGGFSCMKPGNACLAYCTNNTQCCDGRSCVVGSPAACGGKYMARSTIASYKNLSFKDACTLDGTSDRPASSTWGGAEASFKLTAAADGMVTVHLHGIGGPDADLFVFEPDNCASAYCCTAVHACHASAHTDPTVDEEVTLAVVKGQSYEIVVDSTADGMATFDLTVTCP